MNEKMTFEKATSLAADFKNVIRPEASLVARQIVVEALMFLEGHASRDPEVEKLKSCTKEKFSCPCGETTYLLEQNPNHFVGCISHNPTEVEKLKEKIEKMEAHDDKIRTSIGEAYSADIDREREASRKLVEALKSIAANTCCDKCQEAALVARCALKFSATPGHSPEGKGDLNHD